MGVTLAEKLASASKRLSTLTTERLILRPFTFEDAHDVFDYAKDEEVALYTTFDAHTSLDDSYAFLFDVVLPSYERGDLGPYALDFGGKVIGAIELRLMGSCIRAHTREMGIVLNQCYWGRGFYAEAATALITYAFSQADIYRILACIQIDNKKTIKATEKLGFIYEGRERSGRFFKGQYADLVHYSLLKPEWQGS